jgi:GLPGLI family protein
LKKQIILFILAITTAYSQNNINSGIAKYTLTVSHNTAFDNLPQRLKDFTLKQEEEANGISFCLNFNKNQSSFAACDLNDSEKAELHVKTKNKLITNFTDGYLMYNNSSAIMGTIANNEYIIKDTIKYNWNLMQEKKLIDGYKCFKAETSYILYTKVPQKITVTAWYCPTIPFQTGPNGYYGLPGLIMELHDRNVVFGIDKIELSEKDIEITNPKTGKLISKEDYESISHDKQKQIQEDNTRRNSERR